MKKQSFISKTFLVLTLSSGSIWLGAYTAKLFLTYNLFEAKDLTLKTSFNSEALVNNIVSFLPVFTTTFSSYIALIVFLLLFLVTAKLSLKNNGWFFISLMIVLFTFPFEVYLMIIDYKLISMMLSGSFNSEFALNLMRDRITVLGSFPLIEIFSYIAIISLLVFKPLTINHSDNEN